MAERIVEVERHLAATPEEVFGFLTDAARYTLWMGRAAELDPRPGGIYRVTMSEDTVALGEYVDLVPYRRIAFTWGWVGNAEIPPGSSHVEISLAPVGEGTILRLRHTGLPDGASTTMHREGWESYLIRLIAVVRGMAPPPIP